MTNPSPSPGPRPAVRSGDEAAQEIWAKLCLYFEGPALDSWDSGVVQGLVSALWFLTGEGHESIRARAVDQAKREAEGNEEN